MLRRSFTLYENFRELTTASKASFKAFGKVKKADWKLDFYSSVCSVSV